MGIDLVSAAIVRYAHLKPRPYKALMMACRVALDQPNGRGQAACMYFGGWEPLATAMGFDVPAGTDSKTRARRKKLQVYVSEALTELEKAGAIKRLEGHPRTRYRQSIRILLGNQVDSAQGPEIRDPDEPDSGSRNPGTSGSRKTGPTRVPKNGTRGSRETGPLGHIEEGGEDLTEDEHGPVGDQPQAPDDPEAERRRQLDALSELTRRHTA